MMNIKIFTLEIVNDNEFLGLLEGDEVQVSTIEQPRANGKDIALLEVDRKQFLSTFTRLGNQILLLGERIQVIRMEHVKVLGKVVGGSFEENKKPLL